MSKTPFMPLWVSDFLGDTLDLDATEIGAYLMLLMAQWNRDGGSLPDDMEKLRRITRCGRNWPKVWGVLERFFSRDDEGIFNARLRIEAQTVAAKRLVNSHNGARGGNAKALKSKDQAIANATNSLQRNPSIPEPYTEIEEDTVAKATDGGAVDPVKMIFDQGVKILTGAGVSERNARTFIGKLRKDHQDGQILTAIMDCGRAGAVDPIPWITRVLSKPQQPSLQDIFNRIN